MGRFGWRLALALALLTPSLAAAQDAASPAPLEKLSLKPHRVKGLLLGYGYTVGEFTGEVRSRAQATRALVYSSDRGKTVFTLSSPRLSAPMTVSCAGGRSHMKLAWIEFNVRELAYVCSYEGGPPDADFALAFSDVRGLASLQQPQRAAQQVFGGVTLQARTKRMPGAMMIGGGRVLSYQITHDGREVGGLVRGMMQPTFYLPPAGSPERDAVAVTALSLFFFPDPDDQP
ncbi:hypothetical protein [Phenylobacterium sp.]|uniref:hypothetical protein n=1 Tax=Phenylobacterium sp. TaxID=1871053 RepID=UPI002733F213|nr:hypothetical protein [Phenylobacterium sp.]MDP3659892.1 hypothetical protein [Phenylobacterium sp.]